MPSMRRRLRGFTTRVAATRDETPEPQVPEPAVTEPAAPVGDNGGVPVLTDSSPAAADPAIEAGPAPDAMCAAAVELAREAALEAGGKSVGEHLGVEAEALGEGELVVTHSFATADPAYVGWRWAVTVTRVEGSDVVTVDEVVLLPGSGALLAPAWVPWSERVQPGDLAPGDLLPTAPDDPRLVPSYADPEAELAAEAFWELGLGRHRVLSFEGRTDTAERWYDGDRGPATPMARQAPGQCLDCGFRLQLAGGMRALFGVCANALSPDDGKVVSLDHGCGAHSEVLVELTHGDTSAGMVVEDEELELVAVGPSPDDETPDGHAS